MTESINVSLRANQCMWGACRAQIWQHTHTYIHAYTHIYTHTFINVFMYVRTVRHANCVSPKVFLCFALYTYSIGPPPPLRQLQSAAAARRRRNVLQAPQRAGKQFTYSTRNSYQPFINPLYIHMYLYMYPYSHIYEHIIIYVYMHIYIGVDWVFIGVPRTVRETDFSWRTVLTYSTWSPYQPLIKPYICIYVYMFICIYVHKYMYI